MSRECACGRPTDRYGCRVCEDALAQDLGDIPALVVELDTTLARLGRAAAGGGKSRETSLLFHPQASETLSRLRSTLRTWAAHIGVHSSDLVPKKTAQSWSGRAVIPAPPATDVAVLAARWLLRNLKLVRNNERFGEIRGDIREAVRDARRAIDRPADRAYAGPCDGLGSLTVVVDEQPPCGYDLLADPEWETVRCRTCGYEYDVALRRQWMLDDLRGFEGSSIQVSRIVTALGVKVSPSAIRMWVQRQKLQARSWVERDDKPPRPLYRVDDVIAVAAGQTVDYEEAS